MRHLQTLKLIQDVARAGSIRKAAEDLNITSSALNRRIQAFEAEFGAQIFERLPRGVRLTSAPARRCRASRDRRRGRRGW